VNEGEKVDYSLFLHHTLWYPSLSFVSLKSQTIPIGMLSFMNTCILVHRILYSFRIQMSACHFLLRFVGVAFVIQTAIHSHMYTTHLPAG
jgi:hypothetical protein